MLRLMSIKITLVFAIKNVCLMSTGNQYGFCTRIGVGMGKCLSLQVPEDVCLYADPQVIYEYLFADGVRNWGRNVCYLTSYV